MRWRGKVKMASTQLELKFRPLPYVNNDCQVLGASHDRCYRQKSHHYYLKIVKSHKNLKLYLGIKRVEKDLCLFLTGKLLRK